MLDAISRAPDRLRRLMRAIGGDPAQRFNLLRKAGRLLVPEYRFKMPVMTWWGDDQFTDYLRRFNELDLLNADRRWMLGQLLRLVEGVDGDTAECGVYEGAASYLICQASARTRPGERTHLLFDSFEGLSEPESRDGAYWAKGNLATREEVARRNLEQFQDLFFLTGWIPDRFPEAASHRFAFAHIDVDLAQPTYDSFAFLYPRLNPGGIIVCDDYGCTTCPGATEAIDSYLRDRPEKMLALSCGGGFMIKGVQTGLAETAADTLPELGSLTTTADRPAARAA